VPTRTPNPEGLVATCVGDEECEMEKGRRGVGGGCLRIVVVENDSTDEVEKHAEIGVARDSGEPSCMLSSSGMGDRWKVGLGGRKTSGQPVRQGYSGILGVGRSDLADGTGTWESKHVREAGISHHCGWLRMLVRIGYAQEQTCGTSPSSRSCT